MKEFDYNKADSLLAAADTLKGVDEELEAKILIQLSKLIKEYNGNG